MTVLVIAELSVPPEQSEALNDAVMVMTAATVLEDGCITYRPLADIERPGTIVIVEKWTTEEALTAHGKMPHIAQFRETMPDVKVQIEKFTI